MTSRSTPRFGLPSIFQIALIKCIADLTVDMWARAVKRYKPRAAKGPDGWAKSDLFNMPLCYTKLLVQWLNGLENGAHAWPEQLLEGIVIALNKQNGRQDAQGYRPIVLFSLIYRTWSSIRARQLLEWIERHLHHEAFGFLPGREAAMLWYGLQAYLEVCIQGQQDLFGVSTDLVKCFNNLSRCPLLAIAGQLGVPERVLHPWRSFLQGVRRRFQVRDCLSEVLMSTSGFPEGDPLSTIAMAIADWIFHAYLHVFSPTVRSLSFVDNLSCVAESVGQLAQSVNLTCCFADLLDLELDESKTYVWSSKAEHIRTLRSLGIPILKSARELGGVLSFSSVVRNSALTKRCDELEPLWAALKRSRSPLCFKLGALPVKFWSKALHGASGCPLAEHHIAKLRAKATSALRIHPSEVSSMLRLSLHEPCDVDPGFYQLWTVLRDARRLCVKSAGVLDAWRQFMSGYDGRTFHGPFSKLVLTLSQVRWAVEWPPLFRDHNGHTHHLILMPSAQLRRLAEEAWMTYVSERHCHRHTMHQLQGICRTLAVQVRDGLSPPDTARVASVQAGAFLFNAAHSRYDMSKSGDCAHCGVPDTVEHRICRCTRYSHVRRPHQWVCDQWPSLPDSVTHHLLPPGNPHCLELRQLFLDLPDLTGDFHCSGMGFARHDLFTDGSCLWNTVPELATAAWGVVNATTQGVVACGPLPGQLQTTPRAEILAVIAAVRWVLRNKVAATVWSDALNVVTAVRTLQDGDTFDPEDNDNLWRWLQELLAQLPSGTLIIQHVPSHLDTRLTTGPFEDWIAQWNGYADRLAGLANSNRTQRFEELHARAVRHHDHAAAALTALRSIYLGIAHEAPDTVRHESTEPVIEVALDAASTKRQDIVDVIPVGWQAMVLQSKGPAPAQFVVDVFNFVFRMDSAHDTTFEVSFLELLFMIGDDVGFPVSSPRDGKWVMSSEVHFVAAQLTVASKLRLLQGALRRAFSCLQLMHLVVSGLDLSHVGVSCCCQGIIMGCSPNSRRDALKHLANFGPVRNMASLARPLK